MNTQDKDQVVMAARGRSLASKFTRKLAAAVLAACLSLASSSGAATDIEALQKGSEGGDAEAQFQLARHYFSGKGVERDERKAFELTKSAADKGHPEALVNLGFCHFKGIAVQKSEAAAFALFKRAAAAGSTKAKFNMGVLLREGKEVERSHEESLKLLTEAAAEGSDDAKAYLGRIFFTGDALMRPDQAKAVPYLIETAEKGNRHSQNMLAICYREGYGGLKPDREKAIELFTKAAKQNDLKSQASLARLLGIEVKDNPQRKEALKWLLVSMEQGEISAKKTYNEIASTIPPAMLDAARQEASRLILILSAQDASKAKKAREQGLLKNSAETSQDGGAKAE